MNSKLTIVASILCSLLAIDLYGAADKTVEPEPHYGSIARKFAYRFPSEHLKNKLLDDAISRIAWTNFISVLDPDRTYFMQQDIDKFSEHKEIIDDSLKHGNIQFAYDVFDIYKKRVDDRYKYISELLKKKFDMNIEEVYIVKRKEAPYAANKKEWDELWRKKIKNEYSRRIVAKDLEKDSDKPEKKEEPKEDELPQKPPLSPEEYILKRYKNMKTILDDSDSEWVLQRYLSSIAHAYDPHSSYLSPSALANFNIEMKLSLTGIGALLQPEDGTAMIVRLIPGGPASRDKSDNRLKPGDKIIAVGQEGEEPVDTLHWPLDKIVKLIRGPKGTEVTLIVIPATDPTETQTKTVKIIRDEVKLEEQAAKWETLTAKGTEGVEHKFGVIKLPAFYANMYAHRESDPEYRSATHDVRKLIKKAEEENVDGLILDLRSNGGGSLLEAIKMTGLFIQTGPVVQVKEHIKRVFDDTDPGIAYSGPLLILVNRLSASASEILAGALQDYGRAIIVGDSKTHGKGTVQTIVNIGNDKKYGAIKITTAGYYRISGESTQLQGLTPDITLPSPFDRKEFGEGELPNAIKLAPVSKANYRPFGYMEPYIPRLQANSIERTSTNKQFQAYSEFLKRLEKIYDIKEMPLDKKRRTIMAEAEKELYELQDQLLNNSDGTETNKPPDLVLIESLNILSDMTALQAESKKTALEVKPVEPKTAADRLIDWLNGLQTR